MTEAKPTHGGKRKGAGRKPASLPFFLKKFRATYDERREFESLFTGDTREDFLIILHAVRIWRKRNKTITPRSP